MYPHLAMMTASTLGLNLEQKFLISSLDMSAQTLLMEALRASVLGCCLRLTSAWTFAHMEKSRGLRSANWAAKHL